MLSWLALAARHAQRRGRPRRSASTWIWLGAEAAPAVAEGGLGPFVLGRAGCAHDRAVPPHGGPIRIGLQVGHQTRPDAPVTPVSGGDRPSSTCRTRPATDAKGHPSVPSSAPIPLREAQNSVGGRGAGPSSTYGYGDPNPFGQSASYGRN